MIDDGPETRSLLATALHVPRWVDEVASGCPYPSVDALVGVADLAARTLTPRGGRRGGRRAPADRRAGHRR